MGFFISVASFDEWSLGITVGREQQVFEDGSTEDYDVFKIGFIFFSVGILFDR